LDRTAPHARAVEDVAEQFGVDPRHGLTAAEVAARIAKHGANALPETGSPSVWRVLLRPFLSPLVLLLLVAAGVALAIGERVDAVVIAVVVVVNAIVGAVQEGRAEASLSASCRGTGRVSCATGANSRSRRATWCRATCCCWRPATRSSPTRGSARPRR
jgi:magnesium-transporting ATPase (P-type)